MHIFYTDYVTPEVHMISSVIADCIDRMSPNILYMFTPVFKTIYNLVFINETVHT